MNKKILLVIPMILIIVILTILFMYKKPQEKPSENNNYGYQEEESILTKDDIKLSKVENKETTYTFTYNNETFTAEYTTDNWKIIDSYKIKNTDDITIICEVLIEHHQVHGKDMVTYRTAEDMAYEWLQHNIAYQVLPKNNEWKDNAKDVDLDPKDQWKSLAEIYEDRTGEKFDIASLAM